MQPGQPIDYRSPDPLPPPMHPFGVPVPMLAAVGIPVAAPLAVFLSWFHWLNEPFGDFRWIDVFFFGGPVVVNAVGCLALPLVARRAGLAWPFTVAAFTWMAAWTYAAVQSLLPYFTEIWNT